MEDHISHLKASIVYVRGVAAAGAREGWSDQDIGVTLICPAKGRRSPTLQAAAELGCTVKKVERGRLRETARNLARS